jgi:hypothetical protein
MPRNRTEKVTKVSQMHVGRTEVRYPLRQRTVHNNGVVPQQAAAALRLLITVAAAPPLPGADPGTRAAA